MKREEIEGGGSIQKWKTSLIANSRKGKLSKRNWDSLLNQMGTYLSFIGSGPDRGMTPDTLLEEGIHDPDKARTRLMMWYNWLQGGAVEGYDPRTKVNKEGVSEPQTVSQNTAVTYLGRLRGFYSHNKVNFGKWRMPSRETGEARKADSKLSVYKYDEENGELYVDTPLLQQFLGNLGFRDQGIALALYSTSQDPADLFQLTIGWAKEQGNERRLYWQGNRVKTGEPFKTFFSKEATELVRRYVAQERADAGDDEPIWVKGREYSYELNGEMVEVGGVMDTATLNENFRNAALVMGVTENGKPNPLRAKRFRHLHRSGCTSAGLDPGIAQAFMGHKTPISSEYLSRGKGFLLSQYVLVEPFLTVFKSADQTDVQDLRADLEAARRERDELATKLLNLDENVQSLQEKNVELEAFKEKVMSEEWIDGLIDRAIHPHIEDLNDRREEFDRLIRAIKDTGVLHAAQHPIKKHVAV